MKRVLEMRFLKEDGKGVTISFDDIKADVNDSDVNALMDFIVTKNIFSFKGVGVSEKRDARIVNVHSEQIYLD
ncbi:DUF2922 domain-containing protein [Alkalithermobacter paradoxus]|uniref:DUF2922 domain-containing protein n=1 Tax=Alkalithermobacter paradoxus TaxID=29349 RepID=A0A1V4I5P2_9FIRM|nr:hypothetical protein CLOTH_16040 [[Clostridium] thermoalcaliphilum]